MRLPGGQDVARAMGELPLDDARILIGKFTGNPPTWSAPAQDPPGLQGQLPAVDLRPGRDASADVTIKTTKGSKTIKTRRLGPVGGRIVAETFVGLLLEDSSSYLAQDPLWKPDLAVTACSACRELIAAALA